MSSQRYSLVQHTELKSDLSIPLVPLHSGDDPNPLTVRLLYLASSRYEQDWTCALHRHAFSELFYVTDGRGYFVVDGKKFMVERDNLIIINPLIEHGEFSSENLPLEYTVLGIEGLQFTPSAAQQDDAPVIRITQSISTIRSCVTALREELQVSRVGQEAICQNLLNIILLLIQRQKDIHFSITAFHNVSPECMSIKNFIDSHFKDPLTLEELAQEAHQNKYYLSHTFKDAFGISPIRYLMERRVEESKYLLDETDYSISQIASIVGFSSSSHYSQAFRRNTNMSPNEYRQKNQRSPGFSPL